MEAAEQTVGGVAACALVCARLEQRDATLWPQLPLLHAIESTLDDASQPAALLRAAVPRP
ncbi:MAG: hypothetical protein M3170_02325 [Candidatus Dormibacteraeota bacterium]|nr:hypothetical protein [Candidatus Dormibacteraeota bacterium]